MNLQEHNVSDNNFEQCIKCTVCTVYCPVAAVNPDFPGPKQAGPDGERLRLKKNNFYDETLKYCLNCKRCEVACPSNVKIGDIIQAARIKYSEKKFKLRDFILANTDLVGTLSSPFAPVVNGVLGLRPTKAVLDSVLKIDHRRVFPKYAFGTFESWYKKNEAARQSSFPTQVSYFHGCYVNYNNPQLGKDLIKVMNALGVGDRVVGTASTSLEYLQDYINDDIANLGTIKEADLEAVMACEPDVIFIGGRLASSYDALSEIAPVVYLATDTELGVVESVRQNALTIASMFGLEDKVDELMAGFDARIASLSEFAAGKTAIVGLVTSGSYNVLGNDGRCSIIGREIGFENIGVDANIDTSTHGNEASFEFIVEKAPDYIFVMDRDAAIGTDGAKLAQEITENELVMSTEAYKNDNIVYLAHPAVWYTAEGGITALDLMLQDLESELLR